MSYSRNSIFTRSPWIIEPCRNTGRFLSKEKATKLNIIGRIYQSYRSIILRMIIQDADYLVKISKLELASGRMIELFQSQFQSISDKTKEREWKNILVKGSIKIPTQYHIKWLYNLHVTSRKVKNSPAEE
jgi:hypothetical protein